MSQKEANKKLFVLFFCINSCFIEKKGYFCGEIVREL